MNKINVELLNYTPINIVIDAIRTCWDSGNRSDSVENHLGKNDLNLLDRIINKYKHESTLEHIVFNFEINGISRLCLQELARHRIASFSVKSTRYTLKELQNKQLISLKDAEEFIVLTGVKDIDELNLFHLQKIQKILNESKYLIDLIKYNLIESYRTNLKFSINARSLRNFLELRLSKSAHPEIRLLATKIIEIIPESHKILVNDLMSK